MKHGSNTDKTEPQRAQRDTENSVCESLYASVAISVFLPCSIRGYVFFLQVAASLTPAA